MRLAGAAVLVGALALSGCGKEAGTGELGPVDVVTSASSDAASAITATLAAPTPVGTPTSEASAGTSADTAEATASPGPSGDGPAGGPALTDVAGKAPVRGTRDTLTVWVLPETPDAVLQRAGGLFAKEYPKVDVNLVRQDWATVSQQLQDTLPTPQTPDVVEIASTESAPLAGQGLIAGLEPVRAQLKADEWTPGLTGSTMMDDRLVAVPMYGFGRVVAYDEQAWKAAGVTQVPRSMSEFTDALERVQSSGVSPDYSAFWFPGRYWQASLPWIWEEGGEVAELQQGTWLGTIDSGESQAGLTQVQEIARKFSRAPADADETTAAQVKAFDEGRASAALMLPYEIEDLTRDHGVFALPGTAKGSVAPQLIQGSDLAVSAASSRQGLAVAWLRAFLDPTVQSQFARSSGYLPALASAVKQMPGDPVSQAQAQLADKGRFTPASPRWIDAEQQQILPDMMQTILTPAASPSPSDTVTPVPTGLGPTVSGSPLPGEGEAGPLGPSNSALTPSQAAPSG